MKHFINANLIDGTGSEMKLNVFISVENQKVIKIGSMEFYNGKGETIDCEGKFVMPGLIDCHTHICLADSPNTMKAIKEASNTDIVLEAEKNLREFLKYGVVYIRDVGGVDYIELDLKRHILKGTIQGPDMHCAGRIITMTGGHGHVIGREADGVDEVTKATREQLKAGADFIKVISSGGVLTPGVDVNAYQLDVDELKAAVHEAHKAGKKVATHCHSTQGIKNSIKAGIDSIEHCTLLDEEGLEMLKNSESYIVPTLSAVHFIVENGEEAGIPAESMRKAVEVSKGHFKSFKMAYEAGVKIAMGTDAGTPFNSHGPSSAFELELMTRQGMTNMDAIMSATKTASELIGINDLYGTLEEGKFANILVLGSNPLDDITTIQRIKNVYKKGVKIR